jgi:arylsulfatase A-like enzyme
MYIGRYPHTVGCYGQDPYDENHVCIAARLREHGYETFLSGWNVPNPPEWAGYNHRLQYSPASKAATEFLRKIAPQPFYFHFSFHLVHRPFLDTFSRSMAQGLKVPPYLPDIQVVRDDLACLYSRISLLDECVGRILDAIRDRGLADDTVVVFTTDHGPAIARAKHTLYDPGIRTALLIRYRPLIQPGSRYNALLSNVDLLPTLMELLGLPLDESLHGRSFLGLILGEGYEPRTEVYAEHTWGRRARLWCYVPSRCVRTAQHKLIRNYNETPPYVDTAWLGRFGPERSIAEQWYGAPAPRCELYDLQVDPWELNNRADDATYTRVRRTLEKCLDAQLEETGDLIVLGFVPNKESMDDVPLWEQQGDGSYRLRAYSREESSEVPFGQPLREPWASAQIR